MKVKGFIQNLNGRQGEDRTRQIIGKHFIYSVKSVDIDGVDLEAELQSDNRNDERYNNGIRARIQAKFFEGKNEVKIAKSYVEDEEGIRTDFFALLHTDNNEEEVCYFFSADEIKQQFRIRNDKKNGIEYFVFSITKSRTFSNYKNISKDEINRRIEEGIRKTEEYSNQRYIKRIEERFQKPINRFENSKDELFKTVKGKNIVDKLYSLLGYYKDFRRIISWKLAELLQFDRSQNASTYYNQFALHTNNKEVITFFMDIDVEEKITIANKTLYREVENLDFKINEIINTLNSNLINKLEIVGSQKYINIKRQRNVQCLCPDCQIDKMAFSEAFRIISDRDSKHRSEWDLMIRGFYFAWLGMFAQSKETFEDAYNIAKDKKEEVCRFLAKSNLRVISYKNFDYELPNLEFELGSLNISKEKRKILEAISNNHLIDDYAKSVDELYGNLKSLKERSFVSDSLSLIQRLYALTVEFYNFTKGNWIIVDHSSSFDSIVEKFIEGCLISYSMRSQHANHLTSLNYFMIKMAVHYCDSRKLLNFFQQHQLRDVKSEANEYLNECVKNFFTRDNLDFLKSEISVSENITPNPELRRKIERIFKNLFIVAAYTDCGLDTDNLIDGLRLFIENINTSADGLYPISILLIRRSGHFSTINIIALISIVISKEDLQRGYLLTNCLFALKEKKYRFSYGDKRLVDHLINTIQSNVRYDILRALPHLLSKSDKKKLSSTIENILDISFDDDLYYHAVKSGCLTNPLAYFDTFMGQFEKIDDESLMYYHSKSPYTGISERWSRDLNRLTDIILIVGSNQVVKHKTVNKILNKFPYYNFVLSDQKGVSNDFDMEWILENQSDILLKHLGKNSKLKERIKSELQKKYNRNLSNIYLKYFSK